MHTKLDLLKAKANFLDEALKTTRKEVTNIKSVLAEQGGLYDAADDKMAEM